ncbi:MAG: histidinol dehydrogenase [Acidimicrobiales bacterium]|nr:histidinol dehydrogenase [Acidimicrobiales bacterium]
MLTRLDLRGVADLRSLLPRPEVGREEQPVDAVRAILADVRERGDAALVDLTGRFDGVQLESVRVPPADVAAALGQVPAPLRAALEAAAANVEAFQAAERAPDVVWERAGVRVRTLHRPVDRAGCYVPGGRAIYPSTVLMTAIPARAAGVAEVVLCSPPGPDGRIPAPTLAAAAVAGVDAVYRVGGAQAVAALAYGTESIRPVDVIVGPGNVFVAVAKREVAGVVAVPSAFAGPSEVVVVADATVSPEHAAIDVLVQAEHGPDGLAWLVTWSPEVADAVTAEVERLTALAPRRADIVANLTRSGFAVVVDGPKQAIDVVNHIAPEHLELLCEGADALVAQVRHAGAVFCGPWAPASVGDYVAGPSHVLPTFGTARFAGALTANDFTKAMHVIDVDRAALAELGPHVVVLAEAEGLPAHAESIRLRGAG